MTFTNGYAIFQPHLNGCAYQFQPQALLGHHRRQAGFHFVERVAKQGFKAAHQPFICLSADVVAQRLHHGLVIAQAHQGASQVEMIIWLGIVEAGGFLKKRDGAFHFPALEMFQAGAVE